MRPHGKLPENFLEQSRVLKSEMERARLRRILKENRRQAGNEIFRLKERALKKINELILEKEIFMKEFNGKCGEFEALCARYRLKRSDVTGNIFDVAQKITRLVALNPEDRNIEAKRINGLSGIAQKMVSLKQEIENEKPAVAGIQEHISLLRGLAKNPVKIREWFEMTEAGKKNVADKRLHEIREIMAEYYEKKSLRLNIETALANLGNKGS